MPRQKKKINIFEEKVVVVEELPGKREGVTWASRLEVCRKNPGRWCRVATMDTDAQAQNAQSNLNRRYVSVPDPDADWGFASRGCEVYANYRGSRKRARVR